MAIDLIYCGGGNRRFAEMAVAAGMLYGAQLPDTVYTDVSPLYFADQDFKNPDRERYMEELARYRPHMATVMDWEQEGQLSEVLSWAEEAAQFVEVVLIVPKVFGGIARLPRKIGGAEVRLGYSVPTRYGGTEVPVWEFAGWPVHLLGGSPHAQMRLFSSLNVASVDGNMIQKMATRWCMYWVPGDAGEYASNRWWPTLREANGGELWGAGTPDADAPYEAFRRSCEHTVVAWRNLERGVVLPRLTRQRRRRKASRSNKGARDRRDKMVANGQLLLL